MPPPSEIQFSSAELLDHNFADHRPRLSFVPTYRDDAWREWRTQLFPELREQLGPFPDEAFPLHPQIVSTETYEKCTIHKVIYYSREGRCGSRLSCQSPKVQRRRPQPSSVSTDMCRAVKRTSSPVMESSVPPTVVISRSRVSLRCPPITLGWENALTRRAVVISSGDA